MLWKAFFILLYFSINCVFAQQSVNDVNPRIIDYPSELSSGNEDAKRLYTIASNYIRDNNNLEQAEIYLLEAIEMDANFYEALDHLGLLYKRQNRLNEAEQIYIRSLEINPDNIIPYMNLANIYGLQGNLQETVEALLRAVTVDPKYPESYIQLANIFRELKQFEISISYNKIAIELFLNGSNSNEIYYAYRLQGENYFELYKFEEAIQYFEKANIFFQDRNMEMIINQIREYIQNLQIE